MRDLYHEFLRSNEQVLEAQDESEKADKDTNLPGEMKAYMQGLEDAWECAKRLYYLYQNDFTTYKKILDDYWFFDISPVEALNKIKAHNERFKVGDEVVAFNGIYSVIITVSERTDDLWTLNEYGNFNSYSKSDVKKTGNHFSGVAYLINEFYKKIGEHKNEQRQ